MASKCSLIRNLFQLGNINKPLRNHGRYFSIQEKIQPQTGRQLIMWTSFVGQNAYNAERTNPGTQLCDEGINDVGIGIKNTLILSDAGNVYSLDNSTNHCKKFANLSDIKSISSGLAHSAAVDTNGNLYTWGHTRYGCLGYENIDNTELIDEPKLIENKYFNDEKIKSVSCGTWYTIVLTETGKVYSFGKSDFGQLGLGPNVLKSNQTIPGEVNFFSECNVSVEQVHATNDKTFALDSHGNIYKWGNFQSKWNYFSNNDTTMPSQFNEYLSEQNINIKNISIDMTSNIPIICMDENDIMYECSYNAKPEFVKDDRIEKISADIKQIIHRGIWSPMVSVFGISVIKLFLTNDGKLYGSCCDKSDDKIAFDGIRLRTFLQPIRLFDHKKILKIVANHDFTSSNYYMFVAITE